MKQEGYKAEINESLEEIRKRAQAVNNEAQQCQARMVFKISDKLDENKEQAYVIFQMLNELLLTHPQLRSDSQGNGSKFQTYSPRSISLKPVEYC